MALRLIGRATRLRLTLTPWSISSARTRGMPQVLSDSEWIARMRSTITASAMLRRLGPRPSQS